MDVIPDCHFEKLIVIQTILGDQGYQIFLQDLSQA